MGGEFFEKKIPCGPRCGPTSSGASESNMPSVASAPFPTLPPFVGGRKRPPPTTASAGTGKRTFLLPRAQELTSGPELHQRKQTQSPDAVAANAKPCPNTTSMVTKLRKGRLRDVWTRQRLHEGDVGGWGAVGRSAFGGGAPARTGRHTHTHDRGHTTSAHVRGHCPMRQRKLTASRRGGGTPRCQARDAAQDNQHQRQRERSGDCIADNGAYNARGPRPVHCNGGHWGGGRPSDTQHKATELPERPDQRWPRPRLRLGQRAWAGWPGWLPASEGFNLIWTTCVEMWPIVTANQAIFTKHLAKKSAMGRSRFLQHVCWGGGGNSGRYMTVEGSWRQTEAVEAELKVPSERNPLRKHRPPSPPSSEAQASPFDGADPSFIEKPGAVFRRVNDGSYCFFESPSSARMLVLPLSAELGIGAFACGAGRRRLPKRPGRTGVPVTMAGVVERHQRTA